MNIKPYKNKYRSKFFKNIFDCNNFYIFAPNESSKTKIRKEFKKLNISSYEIQKHLAKKVLNKSQYASLSNVFETSIILAYNFEKPEMVNPHKIDKNLIFLGLITNNIFYSATQFEQEMTLSKSNIEYISAVSKNIKKFICINHLLVSKNLKLLFHQIIVQKELKMPSLRQIKQ